MLAFFEQLWAIARTTYAESIRQPVLMVAITAGTILVILSNPFSGYTLDDDQRLFVDLGLSTIFVIEVVLAAFLATNVLNRELENRTALTVLSKPVARPTFILGKYLGVSGALLTSMVFLGLVFLLAEVHGTLQTVTTPYHQPVLTFGISAVVLAVAAGGAAALLGGGAFTSTTGLLGGPRLLLATEFEPDIVVAIASLALGLLMLVAVAIAASTRLGQLPTLATTVVVFLVGLLSDWLFGRPIAALEARFAEAAPGDLSMFDASHLLYWACRTAYAVVPNFQIFWLTDAITQGRSIPISYLVLAVPYGLLVIVACLAIASALFQRREIS